MKYLSTGVKDIEWAQFVDAELLFQCWTYMAGVVTKTRRTLQDRFLHSSIYCIDIHGSHLVELDYATNWLKRYIFKVETWYRDLVVKAIFM